MEQWEKNYYISSIVGANKNYKAWAFYFVQNLNVNLSLLDLISRCYHSASYLYFYLMCFLHLFGLGHLLFPHQGL